MAVLIHRVWLLVPAAEVSVIVGKGFTVKVEPDVAVPAGVVTWTVPVVPVPTVTVTDVAVVPVMVAAVPPIVTAVAVNKFVPLIINDEPTHPLAAPRVVMVGGVGGVQVNVLPLDGWLLFLDLQVALLAPPVVVLLSHAVFVAVKLLLLKSVLFAPLKPTCTFTLVLLSPKFAYTISILSEVSNNLIWKSKLPPSTNLLACLHWTVNILFGAVPVVV